MELFCSIYSIKFDTSKTKVKYLQHCLHKDRQDEKNSNSKQLYPSFFVQSLYNVPKRIRKKIRKKMDIKVLDFWK